MRPSFTKVSNFMKDMQEIKSTCQNCIKAQTRLYHQVAILSALLKNISVSCVSSWPQSPSCNWKDMGWIPATARCPCASRWIPECPNSWVCQLNESRTTWRKINKWCMKNYIYPWQPVRCVGVSKKISAWFNFSFVGRNFMLFAVSNVLGCFIWLNPIGCSAYCLIVFPPSH